jgi:hypothetical protein
LVAFESVIVALMARCGIATCLDVRLAAAICIARVGGLAGKIWDTIERDALQNSAAPGHLVPASRLCCLIPLANFGKRAQPVLTDESVRAACCSS